MTLQKAKVPRDLERDVEDFIENSTHKPQKIWSESWMNTNTTITLQHDSTQHDNRLALCLRVILDSGTHRWVQAGHPRYTGARQGRPWVAHNLFHDRRQALRQTCLQQTGVKTNVRYNNQVLTATWNLTVYFFLLFSCCSPFTFLPFTFLPLNIKTCDLSTFKTFLKHVLNLFYFFTCFKPVNLT